MTVSSPQDVSNSSGTRQRKPEWIKVRIPSGSEYQKLKEISSTLKLATVCEEARCPNIGECWSGGTATFMVMGDTCTRGCRFCAVNTGNPNGWLDQEEPKKLADTVRGSHWEYIVLTSVDRDDLPDGGAGHFKACIEAVKEAKPGIISEVLIPDFQGKIDPLKTLLSAEAEVVAQNIETVERLTHPVRDRRAGYQQTLTLLKRVKEISPETYTKSSIMLGLGETDDEVRQCMQDLRNYGVDILTLGQYLQPSKKHLNVERFVTPAEFDAWEALALEMGFLYCASGPLVRSSYKAGEYFLKNRIEQERNEKELSEKRSSELPPKVSTKQKEIAG